MMHQHQTMCSNVCVPQSHVSCHQHNYHHYHPPAPSYHHHHHGINLCPPCEVLDPLPPIPVVHSFTPPCYYDYPYRRRIPYVDYIPRSPIIQTNVHNDVYYYLDDPHDEYDDDYGNSYRLSRSKVQLVDIKPKPKPRQPSNHMVVSTFQPDADDTPERIIIPRSTVVRNNRNSSYEKRGNMRLMTSYRSVEPHYTILSQRRPVVQEMVPLATVTNSYPPKQTIKVRSLSPL